MAERPVPRVGVDLLYVAPILSDSDAGTIYGVPVRFEGLNNIGYDPSTQSAVYDADDGTYVSFSADGETTVTIKVADVTPENRAWILGINRTESGVLEEGINDAAPEVAIGFRSQKSDGSYRFTWISKAKFQKGSESYATKSTSSLTFQDTELTAKALNRIKDGLKRRQIDSNDPSTDMTLKELTEGWFANPDFKPTASAPPVPIADLMATSGMDVGEVDFTFTAPTGAISALIQRKDGTNWIAVPTKAGIGTTSTSATAINLTPGMEYTFRMLVVGGGHAGTSNIVTATAGE